MKTNRWKKACNQRPASLKRPFTQEIYNNIINVSEKKKLHLWQVGLKQTKFNSLYFSIRIIPPQVPFYIKQKSLLNYYEQNFFSIFSSLVFLRRQSKNFGRSNQPIIKKQMYMLVPLHKTIINSDNFPPCNFTPEGFFVAPSWAWTTHPNIKGHPNEKLLLLKQTSKSCNTVFFMDPKNHSIHYCEIDSWRKLFHNIRTFILFIRGYRLSVVS